MDGPTFYARFRTMLHDSGRAYRTPAPEWGDAELFEHLKRARDVVYTDLVDSGSVLAVARLVKACDANDGSPVPDNFWRGIAGLKNNFRYVLWEPLKLSLALAEAGLDCVYVVGGVFHGTAAQAFYYARPQDDLSPTAPEFTEFADGVMDAILLLAVIEVIMGETQDAADRMDDLYEIYLPMKATFE